MDSRSEYEAGRYRAAKEEAREDSRIQAIGTARILVAAAAIGLVAALVWSPITQAAWAGVAGLVAVFAVLVVIHQRAFSRRSRWAAVRRFHERGLDRLGGAWVEHAPDGAAVWEKLSAGAGEHPYAGDLDVFGRASLFQLLNTTETPFGERALARMLTLAPDASSGERTGWKTSLLERQAAVGELAGKLSFRERLSSVAHVTSAERPDPAPFIAWCENGVALAPTPAATAIAFALPVLAATALAFGGELHLPRLSWVPVVLMELVFLAAHRRRVAPILSAASSREVSLARFADVFALIEAESFASPLLGRLMSRLRSEGPSVTTEMASLGRIVGFVDARQNEVFRLFIAPVLLWDFHCARALDRWRRRVGPRVRGWFEVLGEMEALASLGGYAFDGPDRAWPEPADHPCFEALALGHPLLPAKGRVDNDVALPAPGDALLVTGSNMSGKSTLLRAIGVNAVLALAGAPVSARRLVIGDVAVATSIRVSDSLSEGVSHFLAELRRLKLVVDRAGAGGTVLFLLDEVLHGTNSRERILGARAILAELLRRGALGAATTHDLGLAEPADALSGHLKNVHFEEQVDASGVMTFDYKLKQGVVQSSNALRLMRAVGLPVDDVS